MTFDVSLVPYYLKGWVLPVLVAIRVFGPAWASGMVDRWCEPLSISHAHTCKNQSINQSVSKEGRSMTQSGLAQHDR
jgi:hypothetical protein